MSGTGNAGGLPAVVDNTSAPAGGREIVRPDWSGTTLPTQATDRPAFTEEELALIEPDEAAAAEADDGGLPPELLAEWERQGGLTYHLGMVHQTVSNMLAPLEPDEAQTLIASWDALPESAQVAAYRFVGIDGVGSTKLPTEAELAAFAEREEQAVLLQAWGRNAPTKFARMRDRLRLILGSMSEADRDAVQTWFEELTPRQYASVLWALAG
jgi:hypothetical protein